MYLTPYQKRQLKIVLALIVGIPLTLFAIYQGVQYLSRADSDTTPRDVVLTNLTTSSLTVTWFTQDKQDGYVVPILNGVEQSPVKDKRSSGKRTSHYVELKGLEPSTGYSFTIISGGSKYTNSNGTNYEFMTAPVGVDTPIPNPVHGSVTGVSDDDVVIYVFPSNKSAYPVSTTIPSGGNWIVDLSSFRKISDKSVVKITDDTELVLLAKNNSGMGAVLEGRYSELFDSNGRLNQTMTLDIAESPDLISYFPDEVKLGATGTVSPPPPEVAAEEEEEEEEDDDSSNDGGSNNYDSSDDDDDDQDYIPDTDYVITHDLRWIDMVSVETQMSLDSGEDTVLVTNLTDVGFTIVWRSPEKVDGYVKYGTSKTALTEEVWDVRDGLSSRGTYFTHSVESKRVDPDTTYYFEIYSGQEKYNSAGNMYSVTTYSSLSTPPPFDTKSGSVSSTSSPGDWIVVANIVDDDGAGTSGNSKYISTIPDDTGNWILTVGDVRSEDGSSYFSYSSSDILSMYFLGASQKKFDFAMSLSDINLDTSALGSSVVSDSVKLLSDYGIVNIR